MIRSTNQPGADWDAPIDPELADRFRNLARQLPALDNIRIPRMVVSSAALAALAVFCDASAQGIGAAVCAIEWSSGARARLLISRSRLAGSRTIPNLELQAAVLGVQLISAAAKFSGICRWRLFSDSTIVLQWIRGHPNRLRDVFVSNRVRQIVSCTIPDQWSHVDGTDNPADHLTRGLSCGQLQRSGLWWNGPEFLTSLLPSDFLDASTSLGRTSAVALVGRSSTVECSWNNLLANKRKELSAKGEVHTPRPFCVRFGLMPNCKLFRVKCLA